MRAYLVYAVIIIGIIAAWFLLKPQPAAAPSTDTATSTAATSTETAAKPAASAPAKPAAVAPSGPTPLQSLQSLVRGMGNTSCTYEQVAAGAGTVRSTNSLYISGGKIRGEFRARGATGNSTNSIMVFDGTTLYTWTEGTASGTKTSVKSASDVGMLLPKSLAGDKVLGTNLDSVSWDCHPWIPDTSMFTLPSGISFR